MPVFNPAARCATFLLLASLPAAAMANDDGAEF